MSSTGNVIWNCSIDSFLISLNNVYFETAEYELLNASYSELNKLAILMKLKLY